MRSSSTTAKGLRFTEYNAETPAGAAYNDALTEVFYGDAGDARVSAALRRCARCPRAPACCARCSARTRNGRGARAKPRIAILDWQRGADVQRVPALRALLREPGARVPDHRPARRGVRRAASCAPATSRSTLIYKRVLIHELVERCGIDRPVVRAVRDRAVCMVNPFSCKLLHKKASLAVLSDERNARLFSAERRRRSRRTSRGRAWWRSGARRSTGSEIDLSAVHSRQPRAARAQAERRIRRQGNRARLGGRPTRRGRRGARGGERGAVHRAGPHHAADGGVSLGGRMASSGSSTACWTRRRSCSDGAYVEGCTDATRTAALLNVTAGGGSNVPTYVIEPR